MRGADTYLQRFDQGFVPTLERIKHVNIMSLDPFYADVPAKEGNLPVILQGGIRHGNSTHKYGILACEDPLQNPPYNRWIVLVPKYLTDHDDIESDETLKDSTCPAYKKGDPLFVGRLADPLFMGYIDKKSEAVLKFSDVHFMNTHPFITNTKAVYTSLTKPVETAKQKTGLDPRVFAYYIDLNVDGRTRCSGGDVVQTAGESAPNVWL
jgi:hypothetical protein